MFCEASAILVNIEIMRAFVRLRGILASHTEVGRKLAELESHLKNHDQQIEVIFDAIRQLIAKPEPPRRRMDSRSGKNMGCMRLTRGALSPQAEDCAEY